MALEKDIEILEFEDRATLPPRNDAFWKAVRLGKEGLKLIAHLRYIGVLDPAKLLPGETEE